MFVGLDCFYIGNIKVMDLSNVKENFIHVYNLHLFSQ